MNGICARDDINMEDDEALATTTQGSKEKSGGRFQLQFVTTVSVNIPSKAEKKRNQKIIRQTVMKNFRQQQKSEKSKSKERSQRGLAVASTSNVDGDDIPADAPSSGSSWTTISQSSSLSESDSKKEPRRNNSRRSSRHTLQNSSALGSPLSPLGAGRVDPFRSSYADNSCHMNELIDHCKYPPFPYSSSQLSARAHSAITDHDARSNIRRMARFPPPRRLRRPAQYPRSLAFGKQLPSCHHALDALRGTGTFRCPSRSKHDHR